MCENIKKKEAPTNYFLHFVNLLFCHSSVFDSEQTLAQGCLAADSDSAHENQTLEPIFLVLQLISHLGQMMALSAFISARSESLLEAWTSTRSQSTLDAKFFHKPLHFSDIKNA